MKRTSMTQARIVRKPRDSDVHGNKIKKEGSNIQVVLRCKNNMENQPMMTILKSHKEVLLNDRIYNFDRVFDHETTQEQIYNEIAKPILHQVLNGYNCTIFAYGQTGTGKTYTMEGNLEEQKGRFTLDAGIIPRVIESLFDMVNFEKKENHVMVSMLELYNEELRDLLSPNHQPLKIFDDGTGVTVQNLQEHPLTSALQGVRIMRDGVQRRMTAQTNCNDKSSRSHCIFTITLYLHEKNAKDKDVYRVGKLNLVDLAGSENSYKSGSEQARAMEAAQINKSLLALGRVINCLVDGVSIHIPYRGSKLTRLLKDSLGGNTKTCIVATIAPDQQTLDEIRSTLDYAVHAKGIYNKPIANTPINRERHLDTLVKTIDQLYEELRINHEKNGVYLSKKQYDQSKLELQTLKDELQKAKLDINELSISESKIRDEAARMTEMMKQESCKRQNKLEQEIRDRDEEIARLKSEREELLASFKAKEILMESDYKIRENKLRLEQNRREEILKDEMTKNMHESHQISVQRIEQFREQMMKDMNQNWEKLIVEMMQVPDINNSFESIVTEEVEPAVIEKSQNEQSSRNNNQDNKVVLTSVKKADRLSQKLNRQNNTALGKRLREESTITNQYKANRHG